MPLPAGSKVLGQKRKGRKLMLYYKTKSGQIKSESRCKCPKSKRKPCDC